jgi:CRISPR system Cascade subunit CasE
MYLSRIELNTQMHKTMLALASPQVMHAAMENCFPDKPGGPDRKLWRTDRLGDKLYFLLLSPQTPNFEGFAKQFCDEGRQGETKSYDGLLARIQAGQQWRFRLRANPVHSSIKDRKENEKRGKVFAHVTTGQQKEWLFKKAPACGFVLDEEMYDVVQSDQIRFYRQGEPVTLGIAAFEGVLQVKDPSAFIKSLTDGIGRAKAYGCGLLTIAELQ